MARGRPSKPGKRKAGGGSRGRGRAGKPHKKSKKLSRMDKQHAQEFGEMHPVNDETEMASYRDHTSKRVTKEERQSLKQAKYAEAAASLSDFSFPEPTPAQAENANVDSDDDEDIADAPTAMEAFLSLLPSRSEQSDEDEIDDDNNDIYDADGLTEEEARQRAEELGEDFEVVPVDEGENDDEDGLLEGSDEVENDNHDNDDNNDDDIDNGEVSDEEGADITEASETLTSLHACYQSHYEINSTHTDEAAASQLKLQLTTAQVEAPSLSKCALGPCRRTPSAVATQADWSEKISLHPRLRLQETLTSLGLDATPAMTNDVLQQLHTYRDLFYPKRTFESELSLRLGYMLHCLNHVNVARDLILANNKQLQADDGFDARDQGFTRARVLIIVPYRHCALELVALLRSLMIDPDKKQQTMRHYKKFKREYGAQPSDYQHYYPEYHNYFDGNNDDCFAFGVGIKAQSVNLYHDFYTADMLIASPLGLRRIIGGEGDKERDFDYLSSIEVVIVDQADVFQMQNFEHLTHVFEHLNRLPVEQRDTDINRIRLWALEGLAQSYRQTILISSFVTPELSRLWRKQCKNYAGKDMLTVSHPGSILSVLPKISQVFHNIAPSSAQADADVRFNYFLEEVLPIISKQRLKHVLVVIPSYFDFVRLRNHLKRKNRKVAQICEYTSQSNVTRAKSYFYHAERPLMLYTERYHFHNRAKFRKVEHVVFYQLPTYPQFYPELLNNILPQAAAEATCTVLYSRYDQLRLARVVGSERAARMQASDRPTHMFV